MKIENPAEKIKRLERCINDLVSVHALPAVWSGTEPAQIVHTLLDALLSVLPLDLVYVWLANPVGGGPVEMVRSAQLRGPTPRPQEIGGVFKPWLGAEPQNWPSRMGNPLGEGDISIVPMRLGLQSGIGVIVAGSKRADFPGQTERLILSVAANQAAVGLQEARLLSEQKRVARELDQKVEQRTEELSAAKRDLQHERDRLRLLLDLNNRITSNLDLHQLFQALLEELKRIMECGLVGLALPDSKGEQLRVDVLGCFEPKGSIREGMLVPVQGSPSGQAFRTAKPVITGSVGPRGTDPDIYMGPKPEAYELALAGEGLKTSCFLPLIHRDHPLGILHLAWRDERRLAPEDVDFLRQIASQISTAVDNALNYQQVAKSRVRLAAEKQYLEEEIRREYNPDEIVGDSPGLLKLLQLVKQVAPTDSNVLITGETGTGKELIARAVHSRSSRKDRSLVKVNCGAIPAGLVESELFGHVKGAFTGATTDRTGRFELADRGTLFLDEVGELPLDTQVKLLRVLQEQEFEAVGSSRTVHVDVRIIAASNRNLEEMVREGLFRPDLFYRLNVLPLQVPSLRERQSDIPQILMLFLVHYARKMGKKIAGVSPDTMERLVAYPWPGNIRELRNVIERGVVLSPNSASMLEQDLLPPEIFQNDPVPSISPNRARNVGDPTPVATHKPPRSGAPSLDEVERQHILSVLEQTGWKISGPKGAAEILKIHPNTLRDRMSKLGISRSTRETP
jgi:formate hydrogenlyase transcriptional activator